MSDARTGIAAPSPFTIRLADPRDADGILECLRLAFEPFRAQYTPGAFLDTVLSPATLHARFQEMTIWVAASNNLVIGTIAASIVDQTEGHLRGMAVRPEWHGHGVADRLLDAALEELSDKGCTRVSLDTTEPLRRAICFYERHGFISTGHKIDFFGMPLYEYAKPLQR